MAGDVVGQDHLLSTPELAILSHGSMRTPQSGHNTPATSLPLSAIRVNCLVRPVTVRLSFFTSMDMPKALPDWRWHSLLWQAANRIGSVVNT